MNNRHLYNCEAGCPVESTFQIISGKWKNGVFHIMKEMPSELDVF